MQPSPEEEEIALALNTSSVFAGISKHLLFQVWTPHISSIATVLMQGAAQQHAVNPFLISWGGAAACRFRQCMSTWQSQAALGLFHVSAQAAGTCHHPSDTTPLPCG